ncbi:putative DDE Tnp4 domain-containing protein [Phytophthora infestans]|nr:putative DDE Tnp4 domain-containing protein [Phytophthora infestans]
METGHCATDSAFPVSAALTKRIITPLKEGDLEQASRECRAGLIAMSAAIESIRQAADWEMGSVSKCYMQLLRPLPFDPNGRSLRAANIHRMYNFRARTTVINQIRFVFLG